MDAPCTCAFCGRRESPETRIWRGRSYSGWGRSPREFGICVLCVRVAIRDFGEVPDPTDGVIDLASRRPVPLAPLIRIPGAD